MRQRNTGAPPGLAGRNAMRTALGHKLEGEFDRLAVIALSLTFQPATRETGKGMIAELYRGHHKYDDPGSSHFLGQTQGQASIHVPTVHEIIACQAVQQFPSQHASALWHAIPGPCLLDTLGAILVYALMDEDSGWIRAAREKIEYLRTHDKKHATNGRVAVLCGDVARGLKDFCGTTLPPDRLSTRTWQRCVSWMVDRIVVGMFDQAGIPHDRRGTTFSDPALLGQAEWMAQSLSSPQFAWTLDIGQALGHVDARAYPALAAAGAHIRREHLDRSVDSGTRLPRFAMEEEAERRL